MRILPSDENQARKEKILQAVVHLYIKTNKPVGSSTILDNYKLSLSSATIRNVLADLEKEGFLTHPHTSAGRIPTDRGYRFYVDAIANVQRLAAAEEKRITETYHQRRREIEDFMMATSRVLSSLSECTGFVLPPKMGGDMLRRVELIPVNTNQIVGVLISDSGFVRNQTINVQSVPDDESLRSASRFLNERLSGLSFQDAQARLVSELDHYANREVLHNEFIRALSRGLFETEPHQDLYVEGASNVFKFPEFRDYETMRNFAQLVDEKQALGEVLRNALSKSGLQVRIGTEVNPDLKDFSVVSSGYSVHGRPVGVLGILGPKRMEYERMMSIVNTVANLVNRFFEELPEGKFLGSKDLGDGQR